MVSSVTRVSLTLITPPASMASGIVSTAVNSVTSLPLERLTAAAHPDYQVCSPAKPKQDDGNLSSSEVRNRKDDRTDDADGSDQRRSVF